MACEICLEFLLHLRRLVVQVLLVIKVLVPDLLSDRLFRLLPVLVAAHPDPLRERLIPAAAQSVGGKARKAPGGYARV